MEYSTKEDFVKALKEQYFHDGVVLTTKRSKENRIVLKCDRGGTYRNPLDLTNETRSRKSHTRLTGCPFEIVCSARLEGIWAIRKIIDTHNHPLSTNIAGHSGHRSIGANTLCVLSACLKVWCVCMCVCSLCARIFVNISVCCVYMHDCVMCDVCACAICMHTEVLVRIFMCVVSACMSV